MRPDDTAHSRDCAICAKHRGEGSLKGQLVGRYDGFWVYHGSLVRTVWRRPGISLSNRTAMPPTSEI